MMQSGPFFTARSVGGQARILDPLGLDAAGATIIRRYLLPGITANLQHARYFSFMAWIVGSYETSSRTIPWSVYRSRLEHALRLSVKRTDSTVRGLIGTDSTLAVANEAGSTLLNLDNSAPSAFEAQYYGASFGAMDLVDRRPRRAPQLRPLGITLFQAMEATRLECRSPVAQAVERLQKGPERISVKELDLLSEFLVLRQVRPEEPEHEALSYAICGLSDEGAAQSAVRARVFCLILELLSHKSIRVDHWGDLLDLMEGPAIPASVRTKFGEQLVAWQCFGDRQAQRLVFGGVWSVLYDWIKSEHTDGIDLESIKQRSRGLLGPEDGTAARSLGAMNWGDFEDKCAKQMGATAIERLLHRRKLVEVLLSHPKPPVSAERRLRIALELAAVTTVSWRIDERASEVLSLALHEAGGAFRLSLAWMVNQLEEKRFWRITEIVDWLIDRCVLDQLIRVGYSKGRGSDALLIAREEGRLVLTRPDAKVEPLAQDTNRLEATLRLMEGLSLIERTPTGLRPTQAGLEFKASAFQVL